MKKLFAAFLSLSAIIFLVSCEAEDYFNSSREISVISREDGSGTRGAFAALFSIEKELNGKTVDNITVEAEITNNTAVMMTSVAGDKYAIGYLSLGSLNDTVKVLKIDGALPDYESIISGEYKITRNFNIVMKDSPSEACADFVRFILSAEGQKVITDENYIPIAASGSYTGSDISGKVTVVGSSSVAPVMEKLKEAYLLLNPKVTVEIQQNDTSTGINAAADGICDIGMASRELKESESAMGLQTAVIAKDGIAVIVNHNNPVSELTSEEVRSIFSGETTTWNHFAD